MQHGPVLLVGAGAWKALHGHYAPCALLSTTRRSSVHINVHSGSGGRGGTRAGNPLVLPPYEWLCKQDGDFSNSGVAIQPCGKASRSAQPQRNPLCATWMPRLCDMGRIWA